MGLTTTAVLTVPALDLGISRAVNYMAWVLNGWAVAPGRRQVPVRTPATLDPSAGDDPRGAIAVGADLLDRTIHATPGPKVVLGYSQGAQVAGTWLRKYAAGPLAPDPQELSFLLIGNPERRYGQQPWTAKQTPDDTPYRVRDVARRNDNWADWHGSPTDNRFLAMFGRIHTNYWSVDPYGPQAQIVKVVGHTDYVLVP